MSLEILTSIAPRVPEMRFQNLQIASSKRADYINKQSSVIQNAVAVRVVSSSTQLANSTQLAKVRHIHRTIIDDRDPKTLQELLENVQSPLKRAYIKALYINKGVSTKKARQMVKRNGELFDSKHRYGRYIEIFFKTWQNSSTKLNFETWLAKLDAGEEVDGKEALKLKEITEIKGTDNKPLHLIDQSNKPTTLPQVKYLTKEELAAYEMQIDKEGRIYTRQNSKFFHSKDKSKDSAYIFVIDLNNKIYLGQYQRGTFGHSSFTCGRAVKSAGVFFFDQGKITGIWDDSGHYNNSEAQKDPDDLMMRRTLFMLRKNGIDIKNIELWVTDVIGDEKVISSINALEFMTAENPKKRFLKSEPRTTIN